MKRALLALLVSMSGCGLFGPQGDLRVDEGDGVPNLEGTQEVSIPTNFQCGTPIVQNGVTVTTTVVTGGCEFKLDQDIEVLKASDYASMGELSAVGTKLVKAVEINVVTLDFTDAATGQKLDLQTRVTSATLFVNGQQVAAKEDLASLPKVITLSGAALQPIKAKVEAKQAVSVHTTAVVVLPNTPAPPAKLGIKYLAKPAIILGV